MNVTNKEKEIIENGFCCRTAQIYHLPTAVKNECFTSDLEDMFLEDVGLDILFPNIRKYLNKNEVDSRWEKREILFEAFNDNPDYCTGFLAKIECPVFNKGCFSWGHYASKWVRVQTMDELIVIAEEFHDEMYEKGQIS